MRFARSIESTTHIWKEAHTRSQKILPQVDFDYFLESLVRLCKAYHKQFSMVTPLSLLQDMGLYSTKDD